MRPRTEADWERITASWAELSGYIAEWLGELRECEARERRLRDALEAFANPQHWGVTRDMGQPVPTWIGTYRQSPVEFAQQALK